MPQRMGFFIERLTVLSPLWQMNVYARIPVHDTWQAALKKMRVCTHFSARVSWS